MSVPARSRPGFTLLEMLLVVAAISILAAMSIPVYQTFQVKNDLDVAENTIAQSLRRAQTLSLAVDGDTTWGVKVQSAEIVLFKGASYGARDSSFDETFDMPTTITPSGLGEVVFGKFSGDPQQTGTITLTTSTSEVQTLTINAKGVVDY